MRAARAMVFLLAWALVAASPAAVSPLDRPAWTVGDFWTYRTDTALLPGLNLTGTVTSTVQGQVPIVVAGATVEAFRVVLSGSGTAGGTVHTTSGNVSVQGSWVLTAEERFEPTNLGLVYDLVDLSVNGTYQNLVPFALRLQNTTTYTVVADNWSYPLSVGATGSQRVAFNYTQDLYNATGDLHSQGAGEWTVSFSMDAPTQVDTAAGAFPSYPIDELNPDGSRQRSFASPEVGNDVRTESYAPDGNLTAVTTLTAYRYQALEPSTFLGLGSLEWAAAVAVVAGAVAGVGVWRWRRRRTRPPPAGPAPPPIT